LPCSQAEQLSLNDPHNVSQDNEQIAAAEGQIKQLQEQIRRYEAQGGSSATMSAGGPPEPQLDTAAKMERLLQQEGELTDFIDNFDMNKGTALGELAAHKQVGFIRVNPCPAPTVSSATVSLCLKGATIGLGPQDMPLSS